MSVEETRRLYEQFAQSVDTLKEALDLSTTEAWLETAENILDGGKTRVISNRPTPDVVEALDRLYGEINLAALEPETIRRAVQIILMQAVKDDYIQPNHQLTPDGIGLILVYFIRLFQETKEDLTILNLGVGTGNLLATLFNQLLEDAESLSAYGVEIDETQLALSSVNFSLQGIADQVEIFHQDALTNLFVPPVDIAVSDLPIGYYPGDDQAKSFISSFDEGHSYAHYLFMEQSINYLKESGFAYFILPSKTFEDEKASQLLQMIQELGHLQAVVQLPEDFFENKESQKSIVVVQKKGQEAKQAKEVLFAQIPSLKGQGDVEFFLKDMVQWKEKNL